MSKSQHRKMYIDEKYAPPYPQEFDRFWPKHSFKAGIAVVITLVLLVGLSVVFQVPTNHDMPPLPNHGMNIPAPEWYLLFLFEPFWQFTGDSAIWRQFGTFWIPLAFAVWLVMTTVVVGGGHGAKTTSCISCHTPMAGKQISLPPADMAKYYREVREIEKMLGRHRLGEGGGDSGMSPESFKDANWQLRHFREPTENW